MCKIPRKMLLKDVLIPTEDEKLVKVDILIEENKIKKVRKNINQSGEEIINCKGKIAIPGLGNMHTHVPMVLLRNYEDDKNFKEWWEKVRLIEEKLNEKDIYYSSLYGIMEMIKTGTTLFLDMYFFEESVAKACVDIGIRGCISYGVIDNFDESKKEKEIKNTLKFVKFVLNLDNDLLIPAVGPHAIYTVSKEGLIELNRISKEYNIPFHMHLSEESWEVDFSIKNYGKRPVEFLESIGVLSSRCIFAHCCYLSEEEVKILSKYGCKVVSCTTSNMKLANKGYFNYPLFRKYHVEVCLGTDSACSNNTLNMFLESKFFTLMQKWYNGNSSIISAKETFKLITEGSYRAIGLKGGVIKDGFVADLVLISKKDLLKPINNIYSSLIYAFSGSVSDVIINGEFVLKDKELVNISEEKIKEKFEEVISKYF